MKNIEQQLAEVLDKVDGGNTAALEAYIQFNNLVKFVNDCKNQVFEAAMNEADNYPEKTFSAYGYTITKTSGSVTYDYSVNDEVKELEVKLKELKNTLKNASKMGKTIVDEDTGEVYEPCPIKSSRADSLSIKKVA